MRGHRSARERNASSPAGCGMAVRLKREREPSTRLGASARTGSRRTPTIRMDAELVTSAPTSRTPRWYAIPVRVGLVTFIGTLLCFSVSLLFAIFGTVIVASLRGVHPDMRIAYRRVALPIAVVAGGVILVVTLVMEIRHYRQARTLTAIERMS